MANSDYLNLGDVLQGVSGADADNVVAYLHFSYDPATNTTTVSVTSQAGHVGEAPTLTREQIVLPNVDVTVLGTSDHDIVHNLFMQVNPLAQ